MKSPNKTSVYSRGIKKCRGLCPRLFFDPKAQHEYYYDFSYNILSKFKKGFSTRKKKSFSQLKTFFTLTVAEQRALVQRELHCKHNLQHQNQLVTQNQYKQNN